MRQARQKSITNVYHIMLRGVNKQRIFERDYDYMRFLDILQFVKTNNSQGERTKQPNCEYFAYCLMDNHVHLLIHASNQDISTIVKRISTAYALYFNGRHERIGHLFQDRFKSEPVNDFNYLCTLFKYIHANPIKAGFAQSPFDYKWSSFHELIGADRNTNLCSSTIPVFGQTPHIIFDPNDDTLINLTNETGEKLNEHTIETRLLEMTNTRTISEFQQLDKASQRNAVAVLRDSGVSRRQLSRITGLSEGVIRFAKVTNDYFTIAKE